MKKNFFFSTIILPFFILACNDKKPAITYYETDPGHIGLIVDSSVYADLLKDSFLMHEFTESFVDSVPRHEVYLAGREAFLPIHLANGYWEGEAGGGYMMFQARRPGLIDSLTQHWKQYYTDSLNSYIYEGDGFRLGETKPYHDKKKNTASQPDLEFLLASYTVPTYKQWGFSDSAITHGVSMKAFMRNWGESTQTRLFRKYRSLHVQLTRQEFKEMESGLLTIGYQKKDNSFTHAQNPPVYFTITETNKIPKYTKIEIELGTPVAERTIRLGDMYTVYVKDSLMTIEATKK